MQAPDCRPAPHPAAPRPPSPQGRRDALIAGQRARFRVRQSWESGARLARELKIKVRSWRLARPAWSVLYNRRKREALNRTRRAIRFRDGVGEWRVANGEWDSLSLPAPLCTRKAALAAWVGYSPFATRHSPRLRSAGAPPRSDPRDAGVPALLLAPCFRSRPMCGGFNMRQWANWQWAMGAARASVPIAYSY